MQHGGGVALTRMKPQRLNPRVEWRIAAACGIKRQCAGRQARCQAVFKTQRGLNLGSVEEGQTLLGAKFDRFEASARQAFSGGNNHAVVANLAHADQCCG